MKNLTKPVIIFFFFLIAGCATTAVYTDMSRDVDFSKYDTYAWLPPNGDSTKAATSLFDNEIVNEKIMAQVNEEMKKRGFTVDADNPDLLVYVHTNFEEKQEQELEPVYSTYDYYYPNFYYAGPWYPYYYNGYNDITRVSGYEMSTVHYTKGVVIVDLIQTDGSKLVWRGWSEDRINRYTLTSDLQTYVHNIFDRFPVKPSERRNEMVQR